MNGGSDAQFADAVNLHRQGKFTEAAAAYAALLRHRVGDAAGWSNYGDVLRRIGQTDDAIRACERAIAINPAFAAAQHNLALALLDGGRFEQAAAALRRCVDLQLRTPQVLFNLGNAMRRAGRIDDAIKAYREALELKPSWGDAWNNLGDALYAQGKLDEAAAAYEKAIEHSPKLAAAHSNLGIVRREQGRFDESFAAHRAAIAAAPESPDAWVNYASALHRNLKLPEAEAALRKAIALRPEFPLAHRNLASVLLISGQYEEGWREHEWRLAAETQQVFPGPRWDGSRLNGRSILVFSEQGYGDTIQFARYVPLVVARGGRVIVACQPALRDLLARIDGVEHCVTFGQAIPPFDCHLPMMGAPLALRTTLQTVPSKVPYLRPDAAKAAQWRQRVKAVGEGLKVGLVWTGDVSPDPGRSLPGALLARLAQIQGVRWISLQKDPQRSPPAPELEMTDWTSELHSFDDTAALTCAVDLVITIDTSMAHLAGALGMRTWTLLPHFPAWRWLHARDDSPWYPTMRLFRQRTPGDWEDVLERVTAQLQRLESK